MSVARQFASAAVLAVPAVCAAAAKVPVPFRAYDPVPPGKVVNYGLMPYSLEHDTLDRLAVRRAGTRRGHGAGFPPRPEQP